MKAIILLSLLLLGGCVVSKKRDLEWSLNAMYMIGRLDTAMGKPYCEFEKVKLVYRFPYWGADFIGCSDSDEEFLRKGREDVEEMKRLRKK